MSVLEKLRERKPLIHLLDRKPLARVLERKPLGILKTSAATNSPQVVYTPPTPIVVVPSENLAPPHQGG